MNETKSTKFDQNNIGHQILVGSMAALVDDFGYTPRELFELIEDAKKQTYFTLLEMSKENVNGSH